MERSKAMKRILDPESKPNLLRHRWGFLAVLLRSDVCLVAGSTEMPAGYHWRTHSVSESAAQGLVGL